MVVNLLGVPMNRLSTEKRVLVIAALVEGVSVRATVRMTDVSKPTMSDQPASTCLKTSDSGHKLSGDSLRQFHHLAKLFMSFFAC